MTVAAERPKRKDKPRNQRTPQKRTDWPTALEHYIAAGGARTFASIARNFGVSEARVRQIAKRDEWDRQAKAHDEAMRLERERNRIPSLVERDTDTIRLVMAARLRYAAQLRDPSFRVTGTDLANLIKIERLIEGEATERVDIRGDIQQRLAGMPEPLLRQVAGALLRGEDFDVEGFAEEVP